jgi:hypothetical protein
MIRHDQRAFPFEVFFVVNDVVTQVVKISIRAGFFHFDQDLVVELNRVPSGSCQPGICEGNVTLSGLLIRFFINSVSR